MEFNKSQTHKPEAFELVFIKKKDLTQHILHQIFCEHFITWRCPTATKKKL